ncbi:MAG: prepilin cysteine protease PilD [Proteobacteria bacterium]|nr:prepilin cysteine protease PilD [Pseudomonadota bacterium]
MEMLLSEPALFSGLVFLFSLLVGSFLNVVIHRLPRMMETEWHAQCAELRGETTLRSSDHGAGKHSVAVVALAARALFVLCGTD